MLMLKYRDREEQPLLRHKTSVNLKASFLFPISSLLSLSLCKVKITPATWEHQTRCSKEVTTDQSRIQRYMELRHDLQKFLMQSGLREASPMNERSETYKSQCTNSKWDQPDLSRNSREMESKTRNHFDNEFRNTKI